MAKRGKYHKRVNSIDLSRIAALQCYGMNRMIQVMVVRGYGAIAQKDLLPFCRTVEAVHAYAVTFNEMFRRRKLPYFLERFCEAGETWYRLFRIGGLRHHELGG